MLRRAVYGGTFDPITNGHAWVIEEALSLFDRLIVVIADNPDKVGKTMFSPEKRRGLIESVCHQLFPRRVKVEIVPSEFLVDFAATVGATHLIRGVRSVSDYEKEKLMRQVNASINPQIKTLFFHPPKELEDVSSSMVKSLIGYNGWLGVVSKYVSPEVANAIRNSKQAIQLTTRKG